MMMRNIVILKKVVSMNQVTNHRTVTMSILVMVKKAHQRIRKSVALNEVVRMKNKSALSRAVKMSMGTAHP